MRSSEAGQTGSLPTQQTQLCSTVGRSDCLKLWGPPTEVSGDVLHHCFLYNELQKEMYIISGWAEKGLISHRSCEQDEEARRPFMH